MASNFGFPHRLPSELQAEYTAQQKACMVPKPRGGLDAIHGVENEKGGEWFFRVPVARNLTCYFRAVKNVSSGDWSITELEESDSRIRKRMQPQPSAREKNGAVPPSIALPRKHDEKLPECARTTEQAETSPKSPTHDDAQDNGDKAITSSDLVPAGKGWQTPALGELLFNVLNVFVQIVIVLIIVAVIFGFLERMGVGVRGDEGTYGLDELYDR